MAAKRVSAGILLYRRDRGHLEVLIGHPGGPFWAKRHQGAWSIPKGLVDGDEDPQVAARREFAEETGSELPETEMLELGEVELRSGKRVVAWAIEGTLDTATATSNTVEMDWPRGSGRTIEFPEIDELRWCSVEEAGELLNPAQKSFVERLRKRLDHAK